MDNRTIIVWDIETLFFYKDFPNVPRQPATLLLEFGLAVAFDVHRRTWRTFGKGQEHSVEQLWREVYQADCSVTFNGNEFDWIVLMQTVARQGQPVSWPSIEHVDLFDIVRSATGRWYGLDALARANLGRGKTGTGEEAANWLRSGDPALIARCAEYCTHDVELTADLYAQAVLNGDPLLLPARPARKEYGDLRLWLDSHGRPTRMERRWGDDESPRE